MLPESDLSSLQSFWRCQCECEWLSVSLCVHSEGTVSCPQGLVGLKPSSYHECLKQTQLKARQMSSPLINEVHQQFDLLMYVYIQAVRKGFKWLFGTHTHLYTPTKDEEYVYVCNRSY